MSKASDPLSPLRAAVDKYSLLRPGDRVAVGVSGGKDSVALLVLLSRLRRFYPSPFTLTAITLDPCFQGNETDYTPIARLCKELQVPYVLRRTRLWEVVFQERRESNPCSLCARMRRGALHKAAVEEGCSVVALGHHLDDAAQTFMMNLLSGGELGCFQPKSYLDRRGITLIRPMVFLREEQIERFVRREGLPVVKSACPVDGNTHRQRMKELLAGLSETYGPVEEKIVAAMEKGGIWPTAQRRP